MQIDHMFSPDAEQHTNRRKPRHLHVNRFCCAPWSASAAGEFPRWCRNTLPKARRRFDTKNLGGNLTNPAARPVQLACLHDPCPGVAQPGRRAIVLSTRQANGTHAPGEPLRDLNGFHRRTSGCSSRALPTAVLRRSPRRRCNHHHLYGSGSDKLKTWLRFADSISKNFVVQESAWQR